MAHKYVDFQFHTLIINKVPRKCIFYFVVWRVRADHVREATLFQEKKNNFITLLSIIIYEYDLSFLNI